MLRLLLLLLFLAQAYWESKPPAEWTDAEAQKILGDSPWATLAEVSGKKARVEGWRAVLLSARPVQEAESELRRRLPAGKRGDEPDYRILLQESPGAYIALAVYVPETEPFSDAREVDDMMRDSYLLSGKQRWRPVTYMPPSGRDSRLILIFPRKVAESDRRLRFELRLPIRPDPFLHVEFDLTRLVYRGKPEY